jgi:hypothetical protein
VTRQIWKHSRGEPFSMNVPAEVSFLETSRCPLTFDCVSTMFGHHLILLKRNMNTTDRRVKNDYYGQRIMNKLTIRISLADNDCFLCSYQYPPHKNKNRQCHRGCPSASLTTVAGETRC